MRALQQERRIGLCAAVDELARAGAAEPATARSGPSLMLVDANLLLYAVAYRRGVEIKRTIGVLDAPDVAAASSFWANLLGGTVDDDHDWHNVVVDGRVVLAVQLAPGHRPPTWPEPGVPQQIHLDLHSDDIATAHEEVVALGARLLHQAHDFWVYADPAGHPFCLCWG